MSVNFNNKKGFTLIELLIVIAILGTLAVVVLIALNPIQQLARTRDAGRLSTVAQIGHGIEANATSNNGVYEAAAAGWLTTLQTSGEIGTIPTNSAYTAPGSGTHPAGADCATNVENGWCYNTFAANSRAIVYARMESGAQNNRCPNAADAAWAVYSTINGQGGILCTNGAEPSDPGAAGYSGTSWLQ